MDLKIEDVKKMFLSAAKLLIEKSDYLGEVDSRYGDGDHGRTITRVANGIITNTQKHEGSSIKNFVSTTGYGAMRISGGVISLMLGTFIVGLSVPLRSKNETINSEILKNMWDSGCEDIKKITTAKLGDKTIIDTIIKSQKAVAKADSDDCTEILKIIADTCAQAAAETSKYAAKFGRAKVHGNKTIGTPDVGALSMSFFAKGLYEGLL